MPTGGNKRNGFRGRRSTPKALSKARIAGSKSAASQSKQIQALSKEVKALRRTQDDIIQYGDWHLQINNSSGNGPAELASGEMNIFQKRFFDQASVQRGRDFKKLDSWPNPVFRLATSIN
jgi:hypothetical protein